ncbi:MAG: class I SAM-dependent methyltransferase [Chloroflexia bacterium]
MDISFDELAPAYDTARGLFPGEADEKIANAIAMLTSTGPHTTFLEPGIGTGRLALPLIRRGYSYTGIDTSGQMMKELRRKVRGITANLSLVQADVTALPFKDSSFDVVLTAQVLYLVPDWQLALAEMRRVLKPDGIYLFCYEETEQDTLAALIDRQWFALLAQHGYIAEWQSSVSNREILSTIQRQHGLIQTVMAADWEHRIGVSDYLERYTTILRGLYSHVPNHAFSGLMHQLRSWTSARVDMDSKIISTRTKFMIDAVSSWSAN